MSPKISTPVVLFVLSVLAALVNLHAPTVFFDSQIMLGGSLAVFALLQFGWPGLLVGVVALGATAFRWGHPFELLIGTGFLVWLKIFLERFNGGWSQRDNGRVVVAAAGFWLLVGLPLEVLLFHRFFELPVAQALGIGFKESVTGLLNTTLGLLGFLAVCWWSSGRQPGTFSIRGLAFAAILTAISIPGLGLTLILSQQLKTAVLEQQFLDLYFYGNRAADLSDLGATEALQNLVRTEGEKQFLLRRADGSTISSDPALFGRLQEYYEIQIPSRTGREDLGVYRPLKNAPVILNDADSYWFATFARPTTDISGSITEVIVIETPPEMVRILDYQLLLPSFTVLLVLLLGGTLLATWAGRTAERQFQHVQPTPDASSVPLARSLIKELDTLIQAVNKHDAARQKSRDELQRILEYLPIAVTATSLTSPANITFINAQFTRTFGYTLEDIPTVAAWAELAYPDPDYRRAVFCDWDEAVARAIETKGRVESMEFQVTRKDGTKRDIIFRAVVLDERLLVSMTDVTELKKAERQVRSLREEIERAAFELTENIPVGTYTMVQPPDGGMAYFSFMSTRFLELTGLEREDARENPLKAFACVHPDDYDEWVRKNVHVFEHKLPFKEETRVIVKGETRWIVAESTPRDASDGSVVWEGVLQDITERKLAEQKLTEANRNMQLAASAARLGFWELDVKTGLDRWDDQMAAVHGIRQEEFNGRWEKFVHPDDHDQVMLETQRMLKSDNVFEMEYRIVRPSGEVRSIIEHGIVLRDDAGQARRVSGVVQDITERKQAEAALRQVTQRMQLAAAAAGIGFWSRDRESRIEEWDDQMFRIYGVSREDFDGRWEPLVHPDDLPVVERLTEEALTGGHTGVYEYRIVRPDGTVRHIRGLSVRASGPQGESSREIGVNFDITEEKEAARREKEFDLRHRRDLENKLKTSLTAAAVAHEINQPLSAILLQSKMALESGTGTRDILQSIAAEAQRVVVTIDKMKTLLRNVQTDHRQIDLAEVVQSTLLYNKGLLARHNIRVVRTGLKKPCRIMGDDAQLQLALTNLLRNAVEAIEESQPEKREIAVAIKAGPETVELIVGDSGPGWSGAPIVETPLHTTKKGGTGIGLYVVRTAMENHRGEITFGRSSLGGAEVRLKFPRVEEKA